MSASVLGVLSLVCFFLLLSFYCHTKSWGLELGAWQSQGQHSTSEISLACLSLSLFSCSLYVVWFVDQSIDRMRWALAFKFNVGQVHWALLDWESHTLDPSRSPPSTPGFHPSTRLRTAERVWHRKMQALLPLSIRTNAHNNRTWHWIILSNRTQFRIFKDFYRYNFFDPPAALWGSYIFQSFNKCLLEALLRVTEGLSGHGAFCFKSWTVQGKLLWVGHTSTIPDRELPEMNRTAVVPAHMILCWHFSVFDVCWILHWDVAIWCLKKNRCFLMSILYIPDSCIRSPIGNHQI
jgi:hypothetical protein